MNRTDQKPGAHVTLATLLSVVLLTMAEPGMAHQPPGAEGAPEGIARAIIADEGDISAMSAMVLDAPQPALLIRYKGDETLIVYDSNNEPFLRFSDTQVQANPQSEYWQALPQSKGHDVNSGHWIQVSNSGSFGWIDPRLTNDGGLHPGETTNWRIPVKQGEQEISTITGHFLWQPIVTQSTGSGR